MHTEFSSAKFQLRELKRTASQILELAINNDILFRNVFSKVPIPRIEKTERRPLTPEETDLITAHYKGHRMGIPAMLMLYCGLRRGELLALTRGDINLKSKTVTVNKAVYYDNNTPHIKTPKSKAGTRTVPLPDFLAAIIAEKPSASFMVCPLGKRQDDDAYGV